VQSRSKLPTGKLKSGQDAAATRGVSVQRTGSCCCTDSDAWGGRVNSETSRQMATAVRSTLPPSSTSGDVIASNWTPSEML